MSIGLSLSAVGLIRPTRRRGFCPACRGWNAGTADRLDRPETEVSPPALISLAFLGLAVVAWSLTFSRSMSAGGMEMEMEIGIGSLESFAISWAVMMTAMMLPTALPLVYEFARRSEGRRGWQTATGVLAATYLSVWLAFGAVCYIVLRAWPVPEPDQGPVGGAALALAGAYGLTPMKAASEARCRELCSLHGPLPFSLQRSAFVAGARYGISCVGCSAGLMVAMAVFGMSSLGWTVILAGVILVSKLARAPSTRRTWMLSTALIAMAVVYGSMA